MTKKTLFSSWGRRVPEDTWRKTPSAISVDEGPATSQGSSADINRSAILVDEGPATSQGSSADINRSAILVDEGPATRQGSSADINRPSSSSSDTTWAGSCSKNKPHKANNDAGWEAIRGHLRSDGPLRLSHFKIIHKLGSGDIGNVFLAELKGTECYFAIKMREKKALLRRNKTMRAETEREILEILDHPFLPTLYAHLDESEFTCLVMEVCPGGDLHEMMQRQPGRRFDDNAARFYASEVLLAFEYLHMLGIVYRDLKPENVLVREDGHIMLTDFDLSLKCTVHPTIQHPPPRPTPESDPDTVVFTACMLPCASGGQRPRPHAGDISCLPLLAKKRSKHPKQQLHENQRTTTPLPELVAEPTLARSMSFVGTHEYLAPEIVAGEGHGNAVDWWTLGIFIFELLYGRTPFIGATHDKTLANVVSEPLHFPDDENDEEEEFVAMPPPSAAAKDLIRGLLVKDPTKRMASSRGAVEIKQHEFFRGVNWPLIRSTFPPHLPEPFTQTRPSEFENF